MKLYNDIPELTVTEANRFWMNSAKALEVAAFVGREGGSLDFGRMLNNMADKSIIEFKKSSQKRTAPRLYSLNSVIKLAAAKVICSSGRSYEFASNVADELIALSDKFLNGYLEWPGDLLDEGSGWFVFYSSNFDGTTYDVRSVKECDFDLNADLGNCPEVSCIDAGQFFRRLYELYGSHWRDEIYDKGLLKLDRYRGCFPDGTPLNIWLRPGLSELERARWRLKAEEYIAELEGKPDS